MIERLVQGHRLIPAYCAMRIQLWPDCVAECAKEVAQILADSEWVVFCSVLPAGEASGFIEVRLRNTAEGTDASPVPFIEGWFVAPSHRRNGFGRELVSAVEQWASEHGFHEIASDTQSENTGSVTAHQQLGFEIVERNVCFLKKL